SGVLIALNLPGGAQRGRVRVHGMTEPRTPTAVDELAEGYFEDLLALAPEEATMLGRAGVEAEYRDYSPAGTEAIIRIHRRTLAQLERVEPADATDEVTLAAMRE